LEELLIRVQETLASAKTKRPGSFLAYRPNPERELLRQENVRATDEIVAALNERRIVLAFEPVVDARARKPQFYECLMRVQRADGSLLSAATVIPIAERLGLVRLLDHRVLELAIAELVATPDLQLSINVSAASTIDPDWWSTLAARLRRSPKIAERLIVEITETTELHDVDQTSGFVRRVKDLGCRLAIDDFGAGFTSFRNLRKLGVDIVKIDGSFVQNMMRSEDDRTFVCTLVQLGRSLGLRTVAEWVQSEEAAAQLAEWGCDLLQGSVIGLGSTYKPWTSDEERKAARA
jgi:EAL domain-containing protein (putative c-di-GMP-specific phosphodiesterase class I)